jgi:hypothetical protein
MVRISFFTDHTKSENAANRLGYHEFFVRANHADHNPASVSGNHALIRRVSLFFQFDSQKSQSIAAPGADYGCLLADAASEHQLSLPAITH